MSNFREFRTKNKFKSTSKDSSFVDFGTGDIGKSSLNVLLKQARKSGLLNLANRSLDSVPKEVYNINCAPSKDDNSINFDEDSNEGWWENVFLTKLVLSANSITRIDKYIILLDKMTYLDLSDNKICDLPNEICDLVLLRHLNISKNALISVPNDLNKLNLLQQFLASHNRIDKIPDLAAMIDLELLDISNNNLLQFPSFLLNLKSLRKLNLSHNQIPSMPVNVIQPRGLRFIDLSHNKLSNFTDSFCPEIEQLYLHVNRLVSFPITSLHKELKELSVTHNHIKTLTDVDLSFIPNLTTLAIANNVLGELPERLSDLTQLANLDVSNNELRSLPFSLADMSNLKNMSIEGNPFRAMKRSVIGAGAEVIKEYLRIRNTAVIEDKTITGVGAGHPGLGQMGASATGAVPLDQTTMRASGVVRLSSLGITHVSDEIFASLHSVIVKEFLLSNNKLSLFPMRVLEYGSTLLELDISNNQLTDVPSTIDSLHLLRRLDLSNNKITSLPLSLANLHSLHHLALSYNPLGRLIPEVIYRCRHLQSLALSHCGLQSLDATKIITIDLLEMLDLSNNDIDSVPPQLGLCHNLKSLNLEGNSFKVPRVAVLAKGTVAVMEYLRSRIVEDK